MFKSVLDILFPVRCPGCRCLGPAGVCKSCWAQRPPIARGNCPICLGPPPCRNCLTRGGVGQVVALGSYEELLTQTVRQFKFHGRRDLANFLGRQLAVEAMKLPPGVLVPIPSHRKRVRERGYDHVRLLAREVSRASPLRWLPCLERVRPTPALYRLSRAERQQVLAGAFRCVRPAPQRAILVDDLLTTGATALAAAACLIEAGTQTVDLAVVARA